MTTLLALDPGGSTGYSRWQYDPVTPLRHIEHGTIGGGLHGLIADLDDLMDGVDEVVAEDFRLDGRTPKPDTTALECLGALETYCFLEHKPLARQMNYMKAHAPDQLLKDKGLWFKGAGHDRDSARHAIALMKLRRHAPTLRWLYPEKEAS